jgi:predicted RNA binding protein YcfA (HicA-like mRNA interferase family)
MANRKRLDRYTPAAWENGISARFRRIGWRVVGVRGDHHNFKHPASRFIVTIVHPQKDVPVGRAVDTVKKIRLELK